MDNLLPFGLGFGLGATLGFWGWALVAVECIALLVCAENESFFAGLVSLFLFAVILNFTSSINLFTYIWHNPGATLVFLLAYFAVGAFWSLWKWRLFVRKSRDAFDESLKNYTSQWARTLEILDINDLERTLRGLKLKDCEEQNNYEQAENEYRADRQGGKAKNNLEAAKRNLHAKLKQLSPAWIETLKKASVPDELLSDWHEHTGRYGAGPIPRVKENKERITSWIMLWPWSATWYLLSDLVKDFCDMIIRKFKKIYEKIAASFYSDVDPRLLGK